MLSVDARIQSDVLAFLNPVALSMVAGMPNSEKVFATSVLCDQPTHNPSHFTICDHTISNWATGKYRTM